jgi:hypothetical protein
MSYGIDIREGWRRAAAFVAKIFNGAKPGDRLWYALGSLSHWVAPFGLG